MANSMVQAVDDSFRKNPSGTISGTRLQFPDVLIATLACMGVSVAAGLVGFLFFPPSLVLYIGLMVGILVFGVVLARKSPVKPLSALAYSAALGVLVGAFTNSAVYAGGSLALIPQAIVGTLAGVAAVLIVYSTPFGQKAARATKFFTMAVFGYVIIAVLSFGSSILGFTGSWGFYGQGALGILLCMLGVTLASWSLLVNIDFSRNLIEYGSDQTWKWSAGMSLSSSIVWMYIEILRMLSILGSD